VKFWPVPHSFSRTLPAEGDAGCFWQDRGDRRHAGVDIYAPAESDVVAIEAGVVRSVELFTSPELRTYWNNTYAIVVQNSAGQVIRYAEMKSACVQPGDLVQAGQKIGQVGQVLEPDRIDHTAPGYIQALKANGVASMLHLEVHTGLPLDDAQYLGGNYFNRPQPQGLINPEVVLAELVENHPQKANGGF